MNPNFDETHFSENALHGVAVAMIQALLELHEVICTSHLDTIYKAYPQATDNEKKAFNKQVIHATHQVAQVSRAFLSDYDHLIAKLMAKCGEIDNGE